MQTFAKASELTCCNSPDTLLSKGKLYEECGNEKDMLISKFCLWIEHHHSYLQELGSNVSDTRDSVSSEYLNTEKRVEISQAVEYFLQNLRCLNGR